MKILYFFRSILATIKDLLESLIVPAKVPTIFFLSDLPGSLFSSTTKSIFLKVLSLQAAINLPS